MKKIRIRRHQCIRLGVSLVFVLILGQARGVPSWEAVKTSAAYCSVQGQFGADQDGTGQTFSKSVFLSQIHLAKVAHLEDVGRAPGYALIGKRQLTSPTEVDTTESVNELGATEPQGVSITEALHLFIGKGTIETIEPIELALKANNDSSVTNGYTSVPEPTSMALVMAGGALLVLRRKRPAVGCWEQTVS